MTTYTETNRVGDVLKREFDPLHNRETVTVAEGQDLLCGTVLGKITGGNYTQLDTGVSSGEDVAAAVLLFDCDATDDAKAAVVLKRGPAVVAASALIWPAGISGPDKSQALIELEALGIVVRTSV